MKTLMVAGALLLFACSSSPTPQLASPNETPAPTIAGVLGADSDYNTCHYQKSPQSGTDAQLVLPDPACTPGAADTTLTMAQACAPELARPDLTAVKLTTLVKYGRAPNRSTAKKIAKYYELDHFVPRWMGSSRTPGGPQGSDTEANLWPEPHPTPNAKDGLEFQLYTLICHPKPTANYPGGLVKARLDIQHDWVALWIASGRPKVTNPLGLND